MKKYSVSVMRERFAQALDEAQRGEPVFIERKGVRYRLSVDAPKKAAPRTKTIFAAVDSAVESGQWSWDWTPGTLVFRGRSRARRRAAR
jgi:hypothetical protein